MKWTKSPLSLHEGSGVDIMTESNRAFTAVSQTDPIEVQEKYGFRYQAIVEHALGMNGDMPVSLGTVGLVRAGLIDSINVVQQAFVPEEVPPMSLEERSAIMTHPITVLTFNTLAMRNQEAKDTAIGAYPGGSPSLKVSDDLSYLTSTLKKSTGNDVCPFAGEKPSPIFAKFVNWAGVYAIYADDPSYRHRYGE